MFQSRLLIGTQQLGNRDQSEKGDICLGLSEDSVCLEGKKMSSLERYKEELSSRGGCYPKRPRQEWTVRNSTIFSSNTFQRSHYCPLTHASDPGGSGVGKVRGGELPILQKQPTNQMIFAESCAKWNIFPEAGWLAVSSVATSFKKGEGRVPFTSLVRTHAESQ